MAALGTALKNLTSLSRSFRGITSPSPVKAGRSPRRSAFVPSLEALEDRLLPSTTPAAPAFVASDTSASQINLSWKPVAAATSYVVDEWVNGAWKQIARLGSNYTGCNVGGLSVSTTYYFDVAAANSSGMTWANYQSVTTVDHPAADSAYWPVSGSLFGSNGPSYLDVRQGADGDCWLLASLAEVAARQPSMIRNMFSYVGSTVENGSTVSLYTVRLYDQNGVARSVLVDTELPQSGKLYDHPANGVLWVALAEKAYAEANGLRLVTTGNVGSDSYASLNEGNPAWALHAITGKSAGYYSINPANIAADWNAGKFIVLGSSSHAASQYIVGDSHGTHAYAVVDYNPASSQPFELYNPWGTDSSGWALGTYNGHKVYGLFTANAAFLSQNFAGQAVCGAKAANTNGSLVIGEALASVNRVVPTVGAALQTGSSPALTTTPAASFARVAATRTELAAALATAASELSQEGSSGLWAEAVASDGAPFLGCSSLLFQDAVGWR